MAIIDRNAVFFEGPLHADAVGAAVPLTALKLPGRMEPLPLRVSVTQAFLPEELQKLSISVEEAATADGPWAAVPNAAWSAQGDELGSGARLATRFLPQGVRKNWLRLRFTLTVQGGMSVSQGKVSAALLREEDLPYEPELQAG